MKAIDYLSNLIAGQKMGSSIPVQVCELEMLKTYLEIQQTMAEGRAALANAEQAECGNTPYDEGPFTIANAEPEEDQLIFNKGDMNKYLNAKGIKFVNASHLAIRYAKSKEHP